MNQLCIKNCSKSYAKRQILKDISIQINSGQVIGLLGPNGAGKTTCFNIISGIVKPDFGEIFLNDKNITDFPIYKRSLIGISYLPQNPSIFGSLSVEDNILISLEFLIEDEEERFDKLDNLLSDFGIMHLKKSCASSLSGGERRRLEVARTLATNPKFILLDEPFAGIDPISIEDIKTIVMQLKSSGIGIIITDHNLMEVINITDYIYVICEGKVLASGSSFDIVENDLVKKSYIGESLRYFNFDSRRDV